jgi:hypothetical protein
MGRLLNHASKTTTGQRHVKPKLDFLRSAKAKVIEEWRGGWRSASHNSSGHVGYLKTRRPRQDRSLLLILIQNGQHELKTRLATMCVSTKTTGTC